MIHQTYLQLVDYKRWANRGLYEVVGTNLAQMDAVDATTLLRLLDHMLVVDIIFQHHLQGLPHGLNAPTSENVPDFNMLAHRAKEVDEWYASYVGALLEDNFDDPIDFAFTNGTPARMRRREIILHVCLHGTYHRGNVGIVLHKNGIMPKSERVTDFLETAN